ncbi:phage head closure protein [Paraclostridium bifermentans]|uniref:phage head closure protein n=1 Tax=Paraclostridium bifermentans TaxID=1490 RepID=UPI0035185B6E
MITINDVLELIKEVEGKENEIGDIIPSKEYTEIFAERKSITQNEFYQAQASGLKPAMKFEINAFEYNDETHVRYEGKEYKIMRTYQKNIEKIEITLEGVVNG